MYYYYHIVFNGRIIYLEISCNFSFLMTSSKIKLPLRRKISIANFLKKELQRSYQAMLVTKIKSLTFFMKVLNSPEFSKCKSPGSAQIFSAESKRVKFELLQSLPVVHSASSLDLSYEILLNCFNSQFTFLQWTMLL